jgi:hypothetical protein
VYLKVIHVAESEKQPQRSEEPHWGEDVVVLYAFPFIESPDTKSGFVLQQVPILVRLLSEDPGSG